MVPTESFENQLQHFLPEDLRCAVTLRKLSREDVERMIEYFDSLGETSRHFFHPHDFDRDNAERICCDTGSGSYRVVAEFGGRIVGYAWFTPNKEAAFATVGIGISDAFQGRKLGGALMDALTAEARARGLAALRLTVYKDNERALRLYSSRGYRIVGEEGPQHVMDLIFDQDKYLGGAIDE